MFLRPEFDFLLMEANGVLRELEIVVLNGTSDNDDLVVLSENSVSIYLDTLSLEEELEWSEIDMDFIFSVD